MQLPDWIERILSNFEERAEPTFFEAEISDALRPPRDSSVSDEDWPAFRAEWSAFLFRENRKEDRETYFAPMTSFVRDGKEYFSPDVRELDADTVAHWEERANTSKNPVMRARYADLVWDLKQVITGTRPDHSYARIVIDSYISATDKGFYPMEVVGIQRLGRALELSRSINDPALTKRVVDFMFGFYDRIAKPRYMGTWLFLFDDLYGEPFVTSDQNSEIIARLESMLAKTSDSTPNAQGVYENLDPWGAEAAAQRLAKHYRRIKDRKDEERVIVAYGKAFEHMAANANPMLATAWLQPVIEEYEQVGLGDEAEKLQAVVSEKGKDIGSDLKTFAVKVEIKQEDIDKLVAAFIGDGSSLEASLGRLASYFIPSANDARQFLDKTRSDTPLLNLIPIRIVDSAGLPTAKIGSLDEDAEGRLQQQLGQSIGFYQPFLVLTLSKLREHYTPSVDDILEFLCKAPLFVNHRAGLLREGLTAYVEEDFVKAIHILVPQVERILRDFLVCLGIPTWKPVARNPGVTDLKSMNNILSDARVREALTENLWRYLTVVYIERRGGLNLRNNIAHGLLPPEGFNRGTADCVFHTLLALGLMRENKKQSG